jgi:hypothetical protein
VLLEIAWLRSKPLEDRKDLAVGDLDESACDDMLFPPFASGEVKKSLVQIKYYSSIRILALVFVTTSRWRIELWGLARHRCEVFDSGRATSE